MKAPADPEPRTIPVLRMLLAAVFLEFTGCKTATDALVEPRIAVSEPRPVGAGEDIFNRAVISALTPGIVVTVRVSPSGIELLQTQMMLVPKTPRRAGGRGDQVVVTALGDGSLVSQVAATDPVVVFLEGRGPSRQEVRIVSLAVPTPTLVDSLEVRVTARGDSRRFDVSKVIQGYCVQAKDSPTCRVAARNPNP